MMNFYKTPKLDALTEKFNDFENRFQVKLDEQNTAHKIHIQKLDDKIARLEEENSRTFELIDKLYEYRFQEINNNTAKLSEQMSGKLNQCISVYDNKLENTFTTLQKVMLLTKEKITVIMDKIEICMNESKNVEEQINTVSELDDKIYVNVCELYEKIDETNKEIEVMEDKLNENIQDVKDKLDEKIDGLEEKHSLTGELLLDVQNDIILINTHSKLGNKSQQILNNEISEKINVLEIRSSTQFNFNMNISDTIKKITDNVSNIQNINNKFDREIHTLTTHQHITDIPKCITDRTAEYMNESYPILKMMTDIVRTGVETDTLTATEIYTSIKNSEYYQLISKMEKRRFTKPATIDFLKKHSLYSNSFYERRTIGKKEYNSTLFGFKINVEKESNIDAQTI